MTCYETVPTLLLGPQDAWRGGGQTSWEVKTALIKLTQGAGLQVCVEVVGYLLEELRDAKNYALFQKDMQNANIFVGSLIFIEELAEKVRACLVSLCGIHCAVTCSVKTCCKWQASDIQRYCRLWRR